MKRILPIAALMTLLASCVPTPTIPPAQSVTGYWTGDISKYGMSVSITAHITLNNAAGDFTGKANLRGLIARDDVNVTGNVTAGTLVAAQGSDVVSCTGTFKDNNKYSGSCTYNGYSAPIYLTRQSD